MIESKDKVVCEVEADITKVAEEITVEIKEIIFNFPRHFFENRLLKFGQPLLCQILERPDGTRYQKFVERIDRKPSKERDKIFKLLDEIKFK